MPSLLYGRADIERGNSLVDNAISTSVPSIRNRTLFEAIIRDPTKDPMPGFKINQRRATRILGLIVWQSRAIYIIDCTALPLGAMAEQLRKVGSNDGQMEWGPCSLSVDLRNFDSSMVQSDLCDCMAIGLSNKG